MFDCSKICIDKESTEPLHIQLIRELRRLIREMNQEEYDVLPSERSLCSYLKLHRSTVHKAYRELQDSGIVSRRLNKSLIPNASARKRLEGHLPAIGIIIPYRFSKFIETRKNAIHYLKGIFDRAAERGYAVLLLELPPPETPVEERKYFISTHVSGLTGVLLLGDRKIDNDLMMSELFHYTGIPMVALAGEVDLPHIGSVQCRFDRAAGDMAEYFKNQGVHSLGIIAPLRYRNPLREFNYAKVEQSVLTKGRAWDMLPSFMAENEDLYDPRRWQENDLFKGTQVYEYYQEVCRSFDEMMAKHGYLREGVNYKAVHPNHDTILLVCHYGVESVLLSHIMSCSPYTLWQNTVVVPSGLTILHTEERREGIASLRVCAIGDSGHLYAAGAEPSFAARFCECFTDDTRHD